VVAGREHAAERKAEGAAHHDHDAGVGAQGSALLLLLLLHQKMRTVPDQHTGNRRLPHCEFLCNCIVKQRRVVPKMDGTFVKDLMF
jgi:hypothetical protein